MPKFSNLASLCHVWPRRCDKQLCFFWDSPPTSGCSPTEQVHCQFLLMLRLFATSRFSAHLQVAWLFSLFPSRGRKLSPAIHVLQGLSLFPQKLLSHGHPIIQVPLSPSLLMLLFIGKASQHRTINMLEENTSSWNQRWLLTYNRKSIKETHQEKDKFRREIFFKRIKFKIKS